MGILAPAERGVVLFDIEEPAETPAARTKAEGAVFNSTRAQLYITHTHTHTLSCPQH